MNPFKQEYKAYQEETEPKHGELVFLQQKIVVDAVEARQPRRWEFPWRLMVTTVAMAASFIVGVLVAAPKLVKPQTIEMAIISESAWHEERPSPQVRLSYRGKGKITGTKAKPEVAWESGSLTVEVTPGSNAWLAVRTDEARVQVTGTRFTVDRSRLGTWVDVVTGAVRVECVDGTSETVTDGHEFTCLPGTPGGLLGRAVQLRRDGAPGTDVLDTINRGLVVASGGPIASELVVLKIQTLVSLGEEADALALAEAYLAANPKHRRHELLRLAARIAQKVKGCDAALPHLEALLESPAAVKKEDREHYEMCAKK